MAWLPRSAGAVTLRLLRADDLRAFHAYRQDPVVGRYQGWAPMSATEAAVFIQQMSKVASLRRGEWTQLAIARTEDDALVGDLGIHVAEHGDHAEIGFTLAPTQTGRGYASVAVAAAIDLLFERPEIEQVVGITDARNTPSVAVLERVGMRRTAIRETVFKGEPCTEWTYARTR
jgi:RimJ/RimL family protein N-acetyltransferase